MLDTKSDTAGYVDLFKSLDENMSIAQLRNIRREAITRFAELGFPTTRNEEWKYTSVLPLQSEQFLIPANEPAWLLGWAAKDKFATLSRIRLVFVNGRYSAKLSETEGLPRQVIVQNIKSSLPGIALIKDRLADSYESEANSFVLMNAAFFEDGAYLEIPRNVVVEEPIQIVYLTANEGNPTMAFPRTLIVAEENAQATIIESYSSAEEDCIYFNNAFTDFVLGDNANLNHYRLGFESFKAFHISTSRVCMSVNSHFSSTSVNIGGALVRNDIEADLAEQGAHCTLNGLYLVDGKRHVDNHTNIQHRAPNCESHELYKGVLDDHSVGVFNGKVYVHQDAQKTDAKQTNRNLLLSPDAVINTKPQLEIYADDVRCTHGATVGQLDDDHLFYLRTRGIPKEEARSILTYAFAAEALSGIKEPEIRDHLQKLVHNTIRQGEA